jgi:hypothetical protein
MGISQIGVFTIPIAILLTIALVRLGGAGPELLGLLEGVGGVGVAVGVINLNYHPCPNKLVLAPGQTSASCGGFNGLPWLIGGFVVMIAALVAFWLLIRPSDGQRASGPT